MLKVNNKNIKKIYFNNQLINIVKIKKFNVFNYFTLPLILQDFLNVYSEFKPVLNTKDEANNFMQIINMVKCLDFKGIDLNNLKCDVKYPFFALVAHYAVMNGLSKKIGIVSSNGALASSSVGDVSVSFQSSPYNTKGDDTTYYLSLTPYGMFYLNWLNKQSGLLLVN